MQNVDPIRTTPKMCDRPVQKPIEKFIANLNKLLVNVKTKTHPLQYENENMCVIFQTYKHVNTD